MIRVIVDGVCGRMGKLLAQSVTREEDMKLVGAVEFAGHPNVGEDAGEMLGMGRLGVPVRASLSEVVCDSDVVIEFTKPEATLENVRAVVESNRAMVIGTTGFTDNQLAELQALAAKIRCVMAPNMSVGVNVMLQAIQVVAKALGADYDVEVIEAHHNQKVDAPSGTAIRIAETLSSVLNRSLPEAAVYGRHGIVGKRTEKEIGIHAIRGGDIAGDHTVLFAGSGERIEIVHRAHTPEAFAKGAIRAARWVVAAPPGLHDIGEVLFSQ